MAAGMISTLVKGCADLRHARTAERLRRRCPELTPQEALDAARAVGVYVHDTIAFRTRGWLARDYREAVEVDVRAGWAFVLTELRRSMGSRA